MHTIKLQVADNVYAHIMFLLKSLNSKDLKILENKKINQTAISEDIEELYAFSNHSANLIDEWKESSEDEVWK